MHVTECCAVRRYKKERKIEPVATWRCHLNPAKYLRPYTAGIAAFLGFLSAGGRGILRRRDKTTVVICPTAKLPAEVGLDPELRMESCSRWPELESCSQSCMPQVQFSAEDLNDFATRYEGKKCSSCDTALTRDDWYKSRLAIFETKTEVPDIPGGVPPSILSVPEAGDPICSACYAAKGA